MIGIYLDSKVRIYVMNVLQVLECKLVSENTRPHPET